MVQSLIAEIVFDCFIAGQCFLFENRRPPMMGAGVTAGTESKAPFFIQHQLETSSASAKIILLNG